MGSLALILTGLQVLSELVEAGTTAFAIVSKLIANVKVMQAENRDPTQAEWDEMHALVQKARDELNSAS